MNNDPIFLPVAPELTQEELDWRRRAACKGMDTNIFFPERGENKKVEYAKEICAGCTVRQQCLEYSLQFSDNGLVGIWGGMAGKDRRKINHPREDRPVLWEVYK